MISEYHNRLGPASREWVAALERRIEELERLSGMARPATEGDGLTTQSTESPSRAGVGEAPATTEYEQAKSDYHADLAAEIATLRVEVHEWKTKYESQCHGVKSYLDQIASLRAQIKQRSDNHWTCNGCGFSWNAAPLLERDEHGHRISPIKCLACECESLRAQLADERRDRAAAARELGGRGYHNIEAVIVGRTHHEGMLRDECNAIVEELGRCKAQLAARPVVETKRVEAWVAGDRPPRKNEVCVDVDDGIIETAEYAHDDDSAFLVLNRVTLNVVQEPK